MINSVLITGAAGFIGSNFCNYFVPKYPDYKVIAFDKLTYAGNLANLRPLNGLPNFRFVKGDVCDLDFLVEELRGVDAVVHFAAESHVDNSIGDSLVFTRSNTYGTHVLLEATRCSHVKRIVHVSTDEVYGNIGEGAFVESAKLNPNNPYAASKAAAEMIAMSYLKTYESPLIITRGNNNYGPYQFPEKIIPRFATRLMTGRKIPLHNPRPVRTYLHVLDAARAVDVILHRGEIGGIYNIGTHDEYSNLEIAQRILKYFGKDESWIEHTRDRPFNDLRYSIDSSRLHSLGWQQQVPFEEGILQTLKWYEAHRDWWEPLPRV